MQRIQPRFPFSGKAKSKHAIAAQHDVGRQRRRLMQDIRQEKRHDGIARRQRHAAQDGRRSHAVSLLHAVCRAYIGSSHDFIRFAALTEADEEVYFAGELADDVTDMASFPLCLADGSFMGALPYALSPPACRHIFPFRRRPVL